MGKVKIYFLYFLSALFCFNACKSDTNKESDTVLDIRLSKQPEKLNPVFFPNALSREVCQYIFLPLADFNPQTYELEPLLIKAMPQAERITEGLHKGQIKYSFEVLEEAVWDDGQPVTGDDYLFTYKAILHPGTSAASYRSLVKNIVAIEIDTTNRKAVSVFFKQPYINALGLVVNVEILPKHIYDKAGVLDKIEFGDLVDESAAEQLVVKDSSLTKFAADMNSPGFTKDVVVGCGPYELTQWNTDQNIILSKKKNYWASGKKQTSFVQGPEQIVFHIIPDETAALTRLQNKELDVLSGVNINNFQQLQKDSLNQYSFHTPQLIKFYHLLLNLNDPILKSKNVRKALASVIDVNQFIQTFEGGEATRTIGFINPIKPYYNKSIKPYAHDVEKAKTLLKEDGWTDSNNNGIVDKKIDGKWTELNIGLFFSGDLGQNMGLLMQEEAKKAGINIELTKKESSQLRKENIETGKYSAALQAASADLSLDDLELRFHSKNAELGEGNLGFYINPKVDLLLEGIKETTSNEERVKMYLELQTIMHEDLPYIFLYSPKERIINSNKWKVNTNAKRPGYQANTFTAN